MLILLACATAQFPPPSEWKETNPLYFTDNFRYSASVNDSFVFLTSYEQSNLPFDFVIGKPLME